MTNVASRAKTCVDLLTQCAELLRQPDYQNHDNIFENEVVDALGRYRIWAGNIGALHRAETKSSLEYRLREAPKIVTQINEILEELEESLGDAVSIISNARGNRTGVVMVGPGVSIRSDDKEEISEIQEIFESVNDAINSLFRFSILLRNNTNRDRFAKAMAASSSPFNDQFDICHVDHKFPTLRLAGKEWLIERLGKAITQRRQFLRYSREHRDKTSRDRDSESNAVPQQTLSPVHAMPIEHHLSPRSDIFKPPSTLAHTQASTLVLRAGEIIEEELVTDTQSQTSYATSMDEGSGNAKLHVIPVEDVAKGLKHFECIYCWQIQKAQSQKAWKKHVLSDLKPYVCMFQECELKLFSDRHTWFSHELKDHRREFQCHFCSHLPFKNGATYQHHLVTSHQLSITNDQLPVVLEMSQRAVTSVSPADCPFCEDWEKRLRAVNTHIPLSESLIVSPSQFQQHVGVHMEQLALFAIPRGYVENGDADSGSAAAPHNDSKSGGSSIGDSNGLISDDVEDLVHCQEVLEELLSEGYVSGHFKHQPSFPTFSMWLPTRDFVRVVPLDLGTISQKLATGKYTTARNFQLDIVLMFAMHRIVRTNERDLYNDSKAGRLFNAGWHVKLSAQSFSSLVREVENKMRWIFFNARNLPFRFLEHQNTQNINLIIDNGDQWDILFPRNYAISLLYEYVECHELLDDLPTVPIVGEAGSYENVCYFTLIARSPYLHQVNKIDVNSDLTVGSMFGESSETKIYVRRLTDTDQPVRMGTPYHVNSTQQTPENLTPGEVIYGGDSDNDEENESPQRDIQDDPEAYEDLHSHPQIERRNSQTLRYSKTVQTGDLEAQPPDASPNSRKPTVAIGDTDGKPPKEYTVQQKQGILAKLWLDKKRLIVDSNIPFTDLLECKRGTDSTLEIRYQTGAESIPVVLQLDADSVILADEISREINTAAARFGADQGLFSSKEMSRLISEHHAPLDNIAANSSTSSDNSNSVAKSDPIEDVFFLVMGTTGSGKSTFIQECSGTKVEIGHDLQRCTTEVQDFSFMYSSTVRIHLIDTPGFDDASKSDTDILYDLTSWLGATYRHGILLSGVIYLHRITDARIRGTSTRCLRMFEKLCGPDCFRSVLFVTTFWTHVEREIGQQREAQLKTEYWGKMLACGANYIRHEGGADSAQTILQYMLTHKQKFKAAIQVEMIDNMLNLNETEAGMELNTNLLVLDEDLQIELRRLDEEIGKVAARKNLRVLEVLLEHRQEMEGHVKQNKAAREMLNVNFGAIYERGKGKRSVPEQPSNASIEDLNDGLMQFPSLSESFPL